MIDSEFEKMISKTKTPLEEITRHDHIATAFNAEQMLRDGKFIKVLACGHNVYTAAQYRAICPRCTEMLRRSLRDGSEDYNAYRKGNKRDLMVWKEDPMRMLNEQTDAVGNFIND